MPTGKAIPSRRKAAERAHSGHTQISAHAAGVVRTKPNVIIETETPRTTSPRIFRPSAESATWTKTGGLMPSATWLARSSLKRLQADGEALLPGRGHHHILW